MVAEITFGQLVKKHREKLGLTQKELAQRVNCAPVTLRKIEYDDLRPSQQIAKGLATVLEIASEKRDAFVRLARGQHTLSDVSYLLHDETNAERRETAYGITALTALTAADNPYQGLRAFDESEAAFFFGREDLIQQLLSRLGEAGDLTRFLAVVGPSGSGKSSVVKAGVIPALKRGDLPGSENWLIAAMVPGSNPLEELEAAILQITDTAHVNLIELLQRDTSGLLSAVNQCLPSDPAIELLIVIDQFEELFTLVHDEKIRSHLLDILLAAVLDERSRVQIIITLRSDFLDRLLNYADFSELISERIEFILPLTEDELERAIVSPAKKVGLNVDAGVVSTIVHELSDQPGALPLLQYALTELFEKREDNTLAKSAYQAIGGVLGALEKRAEELFTGMEDASQNIARQLFLRLVTLGEGVEDTSRRVPVSELQSLIGQGSNGKSRSSVEVQLVLDSFGNSRLFTFDRDPLNGAPTVEIAHEVLIRAWSRLREWLDHNRENLFIQRQIMLAAREWVNARQDPSFLATGARLVKFEDMATKSDLSLNDEERAFLNASVAERERREAEGTARQRLEWNRQRWIISGLSVFLILAVVLSRFAFTQRNEAFTQADIAFSRQLAAQALAELQEPIGNDEYAALMAIRSLNIQYDPIADAALVEAAGKLPIRFFTGHTDEIRRVAYSPDGNYVATGSLDGTIKLWEASTGREAQTFHGLDGEISSLVFSPDGTYLLSAWAGTTARLWEVATGRELYTLKGEEDEIWSAAFSPDGKSILTGGSQPRLWNTATGEVIRVVPNIGAPAVFSPNGQYILGTGEEYTARIFDASTGNELHILRGHSTWVYCLAFSPDGKYALTGSTDNLAILWDVATGQEVYTIRGHSSSVRSVAFSPDSKYILTGSGDRTARLWDVETGTEVRGWRGHMHRVFGAAFSPDGKYIFTGSADGTAKLWNFVVAEDYTLRGHSDAIFGAVFSPDGKYILTGGLDLAARLWDADTLQELRTFSGHIETINAVNFSPDGKYGVTAGEDGKTKLWDISTGKELKSFDHDRVSDAVFSPDGKYILSASRDGTAILWEIATGQQVRIFTGHNSEVLSVAFSPDGEFIVTGSADITAKIWEFTTGKVVQTFSGHTDSVYDAVFSPDGKSILTSSADTTAKLWEVATGKEVRTFIGHTNTVSDIAFSPDGQYALTASADQTAKLWDIATGAQVRTLSGHTSAVWSAVFSPDGRQILTGSFDGIAKLWEVDFHEFVEAVCERLLRDFTEEERIQAHIEDQETTCPQSGR